jgi:hypothetical protein
MTEVSRLAKTVVAEPTVREAVQARLSMPGGAAATAKEFGVHEQTLARIAAGLPVQRATLYMVEQKLGIARAS